jgi:hypothetical protein
LNAFVIPISRVVLDQLDREAVGEHDRGRGDLCGDLRQRTEREEVVRETGGEEHGAAGDDPEQFAGGLDRAERQPGPDADNQAEEDADAAKQRRRLRSPAVASRRTGESLGEGRTEREPDRCGCGGQGGKCRGRAHRRQG